MMTLANPADPDPTTPLSGLTGFHLEYRQNHTTIRCSYCDRMLAVFAPDSSLEFNFTAHETTAAHLAAVKSKNPARYTVLSHRNT